MLQSESRRPREITTTAWVLAVAVILLATASASGQGTVHATLSGSVDDPSGSVVPGATVQLTHEGTGAVQTVTTGEQGTYQFARVVPGLYSLAARMDGFGEIRQSLTLTVSDAVVVDLVLPLPTVDTAVTVEASATTSRATAVSELVDGQRIRDLPLNGRGFQSLMALAPGMVTTAARGSRINPAVSGTRNTSNNYVIDGMSANEERVGVAGLAPGSPSGLAVPDVISTEALEEFRVITSNADASFGRGAGGQINVVTKSGTNTLNGSVYEYFRHNRMDARDFFNTGPYFDDSGNPIPPPLRYSLFGGTVGGPIVRDRHFFFASYEGFRQNQDLVGNRTLPNASLIGLIPGDLGRVFSESFLDSGFIPGTGNPRGEFRPFPTADRAAAVAAGFPAELFDGDSANGEAGVVVSSVLQPREYVQDAVLMRTDHRLGDRVTLSARYAHTGSVFERFFGRPGTLVNTTRDFRSGMAQLVARLSPDQILEVRGGLLWNRAPVCILDPPPVDVGERGINISVTGTTRFVVPSLPGFCGGFEDTQSVPQVNAVHTWEHGNLTLRSGFDLRPVQFDFANYGLGRPTYRFTGLVGPNALLGASPGQADAVSSAFTATYFGGDGLPSTPFRTYRSLQHEYFAQADWRALPRLTLNLGVRYSIFGVYDIDGAANLYAVDPASGALVPDVSPLTFGRTSNRVEAVTDDLPAYQRDLDNVQPRLGVAWDVTGDGGTILRGAYGIYHDRIFQFGFANLVVNSPFALSGSASDVPFLLDAGLPEINPRTPGVFAVDPAIENPFFHRTSIGVDQRLGRGTRVFAGYVGTFGRDLARIIDLNFGPGFPQALRPDPRAAEIRMLTNVSTSRYDALQVQLESRPASGVHATLAYTYSRFGDSTYPDTIGAFTPVPATLINTGASADPGFQVGPFVERPLAAEEGRSDLDLSHALAVSHLIELPFGRYRRWGRTWPGGLDAAFGGWSLAGILRASSGPPINILLGRDVNDDGNNRDRPALVTGSLEDLYAGSGSKTQYLVPQEEALRRLGVPVDPTDLFAQIPYNGLRGPSLWAYDVSLRKQVPLGERAMLAIELNAFNVFNRTNLAAPIANLSSALFGTVTRTAAGFGARQLQLGAKLTF